MHKHAHALSHTGAYWKDAKPESIVLVFSFLHHPTAPWSSNVTLKERLRVAAWRTAYEMKG